MNGNADGTVALHVRVTAQRADPSPRFADIAAHQQKVAVKALQAMVAGDAKALICLGGNFAVAMPDHERAFPAMRGE
jgi:anaerobic selenocysteine-containing dehydrogenase